MDISSNGKYPSNKLSNFAIHHFTIDEVDCISMEGFLQSLKFNEPAMQAHVCTLFGLGAKRKGSKKNWKRKQVLYWKGIEIKRDSVEYQELLDRAYNCMMAQSKGFRSALFQSGTGQLTHAMGNNKISETVLTTNEFCGRLMKLREGQRL